MSSLGSKKCDESEINVHNELASENCEVLEDAKQRKCTKFCVFCGIYRENGLKFLPKWKKIAIANNVSPATFERAKPFVCYGHFDLRTDFKYCSPSKTRKRWRLKGDAVPTRRLNGLNNSTELPNGEFEVLISITHDKMMMCECCESLDE